MIVLGVLLLICGLVFGVPLLVWLGVIALVFGALLAIAGGVGPGIGGRRFWY